MTQPLNIAMIASLDAKQVKSGARDARQEIGRLGDTARDAAGDIDAIALANGRAASAQASAAQASNRAARYSQQYG